MRFNPVYFELMSVFDYMSDWFDHFVITKCNHFLLEDNEEFIGEGNAYADIMRSIQT